MAEIPDEIIEVPDAPEENEFADEIRDDELEDVLSYIRQRSIDAPRFGAPPEVEHALTALAEDLRRRYHR